MFVTNWISPTKIQKISEITNFFRHYFLSRTEVTYSTYIPFVKDELDEKNAALRINQAISALTLNGGGPAHINLETYYTKDLSVKELPKVTPIKRVDVEDRFPSLPKGKIAIFIGSHKKFSDSEIAAIDTFCSNHNAVVFCDHCSNYKGKYRQIDALLNLHASLCLNDIRLLIHFGEITGDHFNMGWRAMEVWRISKDGQLRDRYGKLTYVFDMTESIFFEHYKLENTCTSGKFLNECQKDYQRLYENIPELPLSNIWMAKQMHDKLPEKSCIHFGILTSLRSWNFFEISNSINSMCNVGGFGTDGMISSLLGASLCNPQKLYFGVVGDLAFFYDMNALGNRHLGKNLRLMLVNNGKGCEFTHFMNPGHIFKEDVNPYIAAAGHFGNQSPTLVRDYARNLGMKYLTASSKEEFLANMDEFLNPKISSSYIFEIFTHDYDENEALCLIAGHGTGDKAKEALKDNIKKIAGKRGVSIIKSVLGK